METNEQRGIDVVGVFVNKHFKLVKVELRIVLVTGNCSESVFDDEL